jgi:hypothetical protein
VGALHCGRIASLCESAVPGHSVLAQRKQTFVVHCSARAQRVGTAQTNFCGPLQCQGAACWHSANKLLWSVAVRSSPLTCPCPQTAGPRGGRPLGSCLPLQQRCPRCPLRRTLLKSLLPPGPLHWARCLQALRPGPLPAQVRAQLVWGSFSECSSHRVQISTTQHCLRPCIIPPPTPPTPPTPTPPHPHPQQRHCTPCPGLQCAPAPLLAPFFLRQPPPAPPSPAARPPWAAAARSQGPGPMPP